MVQAANPRSQSGAVAALLVATAPDVGVETSDLLWRPVAGRPLITWPLRALTQLDELRGCALVAPAERADDARRLLATEAPALGCQVATSSERSWRGAISSGLARVPAGEWIIVVDATLPLVSVASLRAGLRAVAQTGVAIAGEPVKETLKRVDGAVVVETPSRDSLRRLLAPVIFRREALRRALEGYDSARLDAHDLIALARLTGAPLIAYEADYPGVRVAVDADLAIIETLLSQRSPEIDA